MAKKATSKRRLWILLGSVLVLGLLITGGVLLRMHQIRVKHETLRREGLDAHKAGDYATTVEKLSRCASRSPYNKDPEIIAAFADARRKTPTRDGQHIVGAAKLYRHLLNLRPDNDVRRELAELYVQLGQFSEAVDLATQVLSRDPKDMRSLRVQVHGLRALRKPKEALDQALVALGHDPLDVAIQALALDLFRELKRQPEIFPHAHKLILEHPDDGRAQLIMSRACAMAEDLSTDEKTQLQALISKYPGARLDAPTAYSAAAFFALRATTHKAPTIAFCNLLMDQLDQLRLSQQATAFLEGVLDGQPDKDDLPGLRHALVRRLFAADRYDQIDKRLAGVELGAMPFDSEIQGLHAIALANLSRKADAAVIAGKLAAVPKDNHAHAWSVILKDFVLDDQPDALKVVQSIRRALEERPHDPFLCYYMAEACFLIGERDLAIESFRQANSYAPLWPAPLMRLSRLLFEQGQFEQAIAAANMADDYARSPRTRANRAVILASLIRPADNSDNKELLKLLAEVQQSMPNEETTLPLYVSRLARTGQTDAARTVIRSALDAKSPPSQAALLRLAAVSRELKLGLDEECLALSEKQHGLTPDLAFTRAALLHAAGKTAEGAALFERNILNVEPSKNVQWRLALARYLDETSDARAASAWTSLADDPALASDLTVQRAALAARSAQKDREFLSRTIDRIRKLTGEQAAGWRMARARLLLREDASKADLPEAVRLLDEVVAAAPSQIEPRLLLVLAHRRLNQLSQAIEHLSAVVKIQPEYAPHILDLAKLHMAQSDFQRAREQLDRLRPDRLDPEQRRVYGMMLAQVGETARAAAILETEAASTTRPSDKLALAELYRRRNETAKAEELFRDLLKEPSPGVVLAAANFFASTGRKPEAEKLLDSLASFKLDPGIREFALAEYNALYGTPEKAVEFYRAATAANPAKLEAWRALIIYQLRAAHIDEALAAAADALKANPADPTLGSFNQQAPDIKSLTAHTLFHALIGATLQNNPDAAVARDAVRVCADSIRQRQPVAALATRLRPLADRATTLVPLQTLLIQLYLASDRAEDAAAVARRAQAAVPTSPDVASASARAFAAAKDSSGAMVAAQRWRELILQQPLPADLLIADLHLRAGDSANALKQLAPYLQIAQQKPDEHLPLLVLQAHALLRQNNPDAAAQVLWPHVSRSASFRRAWIEMALTLAAEKPAVCAQWLQRVGPAVPANSLDEAMVLADAWQLLARRSADPRHNDRAFELLTNLSTTAQKPAPVFFALGRLHSQLGRFSEAEKAYRRALELQPEYPVVMNNLAMLLLEHNGNLNDALALATKAVAAYPQSPDFHDTLALVQAALKDYTSAIATEKKAIDLDKSNPEWKLSLASIHEQAGQIAEAARLLAEIDAILPDNPRLAPDFRSRLLRVRTKVEAKSTTALPR